jgi:hypothetical protein
VVNTLLGFLVHPSRARRLAVVAAVLAMSIVAGACAAESTSGTGAGSEVANSPNGTVVQVTMASAGKVVALHVGDTLRIFLGPPTGQSYLTWQVRTYPKDVLTLLPTNTQREQFDLLASAVGAGTVSLVGMVRCSSPGPMAGAAVNCPVLGAGGPTEGSPTASGAPGGMPARLLEFDVTVTA